MMLPTMMRLLLPLVFLLTSCSSFTLPDFFASPAYEAERLLEDEAPSSTQPVIPVQPLEETILTETPTESPAPSPSPSELPTIEPTVTNKPTAHPTSVPTESPAPSPSPSEIPTALPSDIPSAGPTIAPTVSSAPSSSPSNSPTATPSTSPSKAPTMSPTASSQPSSSPSSSPTNIPSSSPSTVPSSSPTHVISVAVESFSLLLPKILDLDEPQMDAIETTAERLLERPSHLESGNFQGVTVNLLSFESVELPRSGNQTIISVLDLKQALNMTLDIRGDYYGVARDLDFEAIFSRIFEEDSDAWYGMLANEDSSFSVLLPDGDSTGGALLALDQENSSAQDPLIRHGRRISRGGVAAVTLLALAALTLGMAASFFAVRSYRKATHGVELISPQSNDSGSHFSRRSSLRSGSRHSKQEYAPDDEQMADKQDPEFDVDEQESVDFNIAAKRSYSYDSAADTAFVADNNPTCSLTFDQLLSRANNSKPSYLNQPPYLHQQPSRSNPPPPNQFKGTQNHNMKSLLDNTSEVSAMTRQLSRTSVLSRNDYMEMTVGANGKSGGGDLKATNSNTGSGTGSDFSSHARNFFQGLVSSAAQDTTGGSTKNLGARAVEPDEEMQLQEKSSYDTNMSRRTGLYDVFAPAGPIGIVVDTTKYGPAVHSLKRTSPMLGLINPGDLIVGLDDEDTRGMTAATLTRLMARKSTQKERKITLLTTDTN